MRYAAVSSIPKERPPLTGAAFLLAVVAACGGNGEPGNNVAAECEASTYATIQKTIFEGKGCTQAVCHGESAQGGLDLRTGASHAALVRTPSAIDPAIRRVFPGDQDLSVLYLKLQAGVEGTSLGPLGQAMPADGDPLSADELEAIRLWIRGGANAQGVVEGTMEKLSCDRTFAPTPSKIDPLPPPEPDKGLQFYSGAWPLPSESEDEVCFVTYYDFSDQVPPEYQVDCGELAPGRTCFAFRRSELAQDGQSHHSITTVYTPESDPNGGDWFDWECLGGDRTGEACDPTDVGSCGPRSACATPPQSAVGCVGYFFAPADFDFGSGVTGRSDTRERVVTAQESTFVEEPPPGVYSLLPLSGFVAWNSHAFNLTNENTTIEQWINLTFEQDRRYQREQIFASDSIFSIAVPPFEKREFCSSFDLPQYTQLLSLTSHFHKRGELFRMWLPPNDGCAGAPCQAPSRDPDYTSRLYDDPPEDRYDPPIAMNGADPPQRRIIACATYDNGADDPLEVKRHSTRPDTPSCNSPAGFCGCSASTRVCFGGDNPGKACGGTDEVCGTDGLCDACPLKGGVTTDDEMFLPLGSYYVAAPE